MVDGDPRAIECLVCGEVRIVFGRHLEDTGECPRCGYVGWTYADDLDRTTEEMILNGRFGRRGASRSLASAPELGLPAEPLRASCGWHERRHARATRRRP